MLLTISVVYLYKDKNPGKFWNGIIRNITYMYVNKIDKNTLEKYVIIAAIHITFVISIQVKSLSIIYILYTK